MDPIADMLVQIKNAGAAGLASIMTPYSNVKFAIATLLESEGYVASVGKKGRKTRKFIEVDLVYSGKTPRVSDITRISKPSRRVYMHAKDIRSVRRGHGLLVLSTPKGILSDRAARKEHVGGEALFTIW